MARDQATSFGDQCELEEGHDGPHRAAGRSWANKTGAWRDAVDADIAALQAALGKLVVTSIVARAVSSKSSLKVDVATIVSEGAAVELPSADELDATHAAARDALVRLAGRLTGSVPVSLTDDGVQQTSGGAVAVKP